MKISLSNLGILATLISITLFLSPTSSYAASAKEIDIKADAAMEKFKKKVDGAEGFLKAAKGVLIFPTVIKAGIGIGGEYGEGTLRIDGNTVDYYSTAAASIGFQLGAQAKSVVIIFMDGGALESFRNSDGWKAGVDGSVAIAEVGAGKDIDTENIKDQIVGFIFGNKGLMFNLTLEGSKFSKLSK